MSYQHLSHIKHRITLTAQEIALIRDRLIPITPMDYDLSDFSALRSLYGKFDHITFLHEPAYPNKSGG